MTEKNPDRKKILTHYLRPHFKKSAGMMNDIFAKALAFDLRDLAPEIASLASESPTFEDGDGADYSGGKFAGPVGEKYHIAREITALWSENDPSARAKLWLAFAVARAKYLSLDESASSPVSVAMRETAKNFILALPEEERKSALTSAIQAAENNSPWLYYADAGTWLQSLAD